MIRENRYLCDGKGELLNADTFSLYEFTKDIDIDALVKSSDYRKAVTRYNPLLWMLTYVPHLMRSEETGNVISVNEVNILLAHYAMEWTYPKNSPKRDGLRKAFLCPRSSSKTTTTQALMLWAFCQRHIRYAYIFSESDSAAENTLAELKKEISTNKLIKCDYNGLTEPARLIKKKVAPSDNKNLYRSQSGITIESRSIWSSVLGAKRDGKRPDLLLADDTSKGEGAGSVNRSTKQLDIILGTILPFNDCAPVWFTGTVHYVGSVESELIRSTQGEQFDWITEERIEVHHVLPLVKREDGSLRSLWPQRWPVEWLIEHSSDSTYAKDFLCEPTNKYAGAGFTDDLFVIEQPEVLSHTILCIDPGISQKGDGTGLAVIGFSQSARKAYILDVKTAHERATNLKSIVLELINRFHVQEILWEDNIGGPELCRLTLGMQFPLHIEYVHAKGSKEVRAEMLLNRYRNDNIRHCDKFPMFIAECKMFPNFISSPNMVDAVGHGVEYLSRMGRSPSSLSVSVRRR